MNGYVLIDKPAGWTSFDVVNYIRKIVAQAEGKKPKNVKVGHAGTLDPFATGLLIVLVGSYTKRQDEFMKMDKSYETSLELGRISSTGDPEGEISKVSNKHPAEEEVTAAVNQFTGELEQVPPIYSAIKIGGKKAYELARAGKTVEIKPRKVKIYSFDQVKYEYPRLSFEVMVSSGTYIRSLAVDMGEKLETGAYLTDLRRTRIGQFEVVESIGPSEFTPEVLKQLPNR